MSATAMTSQTPVGPYISGQPSANSLNLTETVGDAVNGNSVVLTGHEILLAHNTDSSAHTLTITSVADERGRTEDVTTYSIAAGKIAAFSFLGGVAGWAGAGGAVVFTPNDATIKFSVLKVQL